MAIAITQQTAKSPFGNRPLWHKSAPRHLVDKASVDEDKQPWLAWQKHLAKRKSPTDTRFLAGKRPPLLWAWPDAWERDGIIIGGRSLRHLATELSSDALRGDELPQALQALAIAYALPSLAFKLESSVWWRVVESLCQLTRDAQQLRADPMGDVHEVLRQQLLAGELPLALGYLFPELQPARDLLQLGRQSLSESILALLDGKGAPHGRLLPVLGPLIACWTRHVGLASMSKGGRGRRRLKQNIGGWSFMPCDSPLPMADFWVRIFTPAETKPDSRRCSPNRSSFLATKPIALHWQHLLRPTN